MALAWPGASEPLPKVFYSICCTLLGLSSSSCGGLLEHPARESPMCSSLQTGWCFLQRVLLLRAVLSRESL